MFSADIEYGVFSLAKWQEEYREWLDGVGNRTAEDLEPLSARTGAAPVSAGKLPALLSPKTSASHAITPLKRSGDVAEELFSKKPRQYDEAEERYMARYIFNRMPEETSTSTKHWEAFAAVS